ncbi:MAG: DUF4197 family protein [Novosphingobium sp.]
MSIAGNRAIGRRGALAGIGASALLMFAPSAAWAAAAPIDVARRLMRQATNRAFAKLSAPNGFWDSTVARFDIPELFTKGAVPTAQREQLQRRLNVAAEAGARRAGQAARGTHGLIKREDAVALIGGEATAGTSLLRTRIGANLINVMIPALERALRAERDPVVSAAVSKLSGVELNDVAKAIALKADSAIWYQIGAEEGDIRTNPQSTGDKVLIEAFRK